jgi:hypothetical protein
VHAWRFIGGDIIALIARLQSLENWWMTANRFPSQHVLKCLDDFFDVLQGHAEFKDCWNEAMGE